MKKLGHKEKVGPGRSSSKKRLYCLAIGPVVGGEKIKDDKRGGGYGTH